MWTLSGVHKKSRYSSVGLQVDNVECMYYVKSKWSVCGVYVDYVEFMWSLSGVHVDFLWNVGECKIQTNTTTTCNCAHKTMTMAQAVQGGGGGVPTN